MLIRYTINKRFDHLFLLLSSTGLDGVMSAGDWEPGLDDEPATSVMFSTVLELVVSTVGLCGSTVQHVKLSKVPYS